MSKSKIILLLSGYQLTWLMCVFGEVVYSTYMPGLICGLVFILLSLSTGNSRIAFSRPGNMLRIPNMDDSIYNNLFY